MNKYYKDNLVVRKLRDISELVNNQEAEGKKPFYNSLYRVCKEYIKLYDGYIDSYNTRLRINKKEK